MKYLLLSIVSVVGLLACTDQETTKSTPGSSAVQTEVVESKPVTPTAPTIVPRPGQS